MSTYDPNPSYRWDSNTWIGDGSWGGGDHIWRREPNDPNVYTWPTRDPEPVKLHTCHVCGNKVSMANAAEHVAVCEQKQIEKAKRELAAERRRNRRAEKQAEAERDEMRDHLLDLLDQLA